MTTPSAEPRPRFAADAMLGRLARWLRTLGFDTAYDPAVHDPELVALAAAEGRVLLTRDRHLVAHLRPERAGLITDDAPLDQLRQVVAACALAPPPALFSRCPVCNAQLRPATEDEAATLVPAASRALPGPVSRCPGCARVYWEGSHTRRMRQALSRALPGWIS
ncbi:MAG: Mut7-C RNAse domain-containing protein [Gemmatimonadetes bacterium]|nr:Mut7-C RNAse domain-containing protein [Gemmatimonadota bacterium]